MQKDDGSPITKGLMEEMRLYHQLIWVESSCFNRVSCICGWRAARYLFIKSTVWAPLNFLRFSEIRSDLLD